MINAFKTVVFENYANFSGRARRREFWMFCLANLVVSFILRLISNLTAPVSLDEYIRSQLDSGYLDSLSIWSHYFDYVSTSPVLMVIFIISIIYSVVIFIPSYAVMVRRFHDTGKSGWCLLLMVIPLVNIFAVFLFFIWTILNGDEGPNKYGPDPKGNGKTFKDDNSLELDEIK